MFYRKIPHILFLLSLHVSGICPAQATVIFGTPQAPLPPFTGNGLVGSIWTNVPFPVTSSERNLAFVNNYISEIDPTPDANFLARIVDYPGSPTTTINDSLTVADFLGPDSSTLTQPIGGEQLFHVGPDGIPRGFILEFNGFVSSSIPGFYFVLESDDHSELLMKGADPGGTPPMDSNGFTTVATNERSGELNVPYPGTPFSSNFSFRTEGLYQVKLHYFDAEASQAGIKLFTGFNVFDPRGFVDCSSEFSDCTLVPQSLLFTTPIPEPTPIYLIALGLGAMFLMRTCRKNSMTLTCIN